MDEVTGTDELTGWDYVSKPLVELVTHPDYSAEAMRIVKSVIEMTSAQLETIFVSVCS